MQHEIHEGRLLDKKGNLTEPGFAYRLVKEYRRRDIKAGALRIKEWDYYYIGNAHFGIALTIDDNSYMSLVSATFLNFDEKWEKTKSVMGFLTLGKVGFPSSSAGGITKIKGKGFNFVFNNDGENRHLICDMENLDRGKRFHVDAVLSETNRDSMVIATPFSKKRHFYYNQKINLLEATGKVTFGDASYSLDGSLGVLDWGRGVWTYKNTWYWSSLNARYEGKRIGFNLGYGFGDTSAATENMFFYDDQAFKLEDVRFNIPKDANGQECYMGDWTFTSSDGTINLTFKPTLDRHSATSLLVLKSIQHQVFGKFSGYIYANSEKIEFDDLLGFAEKVINYW